jgi:hypothetical protein
VRHWWRYSRKRPAWTLNYIAAYLLPAGIGTLIIRLTMIPVLAPRGGDCHDSCGFHKV